MTNQPEPATDGTTFHAEDRLVVQDIEAKQGVINASDVFLESDPLVRRFDQSKTRFTAGIPLEKHGQLFEFSDEIVPLEDPAHAPGHLVPGTRFLLISRQQRIPARNLQNGSGAREHSVDDSAFGRSCE
jgi:hypothetical protein